MTETTPKDVVEAVQYRLHHEASYKAAHKVLRPLQGTNIEAEREQFRRMGASVEAMEQTDPEGDFFLSANPTTVRFYLTRRQWVNTYSESMRPLFRLQSLPLRYRDPAPPSSPPQVPPGHSCQLEAQARIQMYSRMKSPIARVRMTLRLAQESRWVSRL